MSIKKMISNALSILGIIILILWSIASKAQAVDTLWTKTLGGSLDEPYGYQIESRVKMSVNTNEDIFIVSNTVSSDGDVQTSIGLTDCWIIKLSADGDTVWTKVFGGTDYDAATEIHALEDGGCIIGGFTYSNDNDLTEHHGNSDETDGFLARFDANGELLWMRQYGGYEFIGIPNNDYFYGFFINSDGNIVAVGQTNANNGDLYLDFSMYSAGWVSEIDIETGDLLATKKLAMDGHDEWNICRFFKGFEMEDGGYIFYGESMHTMAGADKFWCVKTDANFDTEWQYEYGSTVQNTVYTACNTDDDYILIAGNAYDTSGDVTAMGYGEYDAWIANVSKTDGSILDNYYFGGTKNDVAYDIKQDDLGNYLLAGLSYSTDYYGSGDTTTSSDFWFVSFDNNFDSLWTMKIGGDSAESINSIALFGNHLYAAGKTFSNENYVHGNHGSLDVWVGKFEGSFMSNKAVLFNENDFRVYPNPVSEILYVKNQNVKLIEIYNLQGQILLSKTISLMSDTEVNISSLAPGSYIVKLKSENAIKSKKIIKK